MQPVPNVAHPGAVAHRPRCQPGSQNREELIAFGDRHRLAHGLGELSVRRLSQYSSVVPAHHAGLHARTHITHVITNAEGVAGR